MSEGPRLAHGDAHPTPAELTAWLAGDRCGADASRAVEYHLDADCPTCTGRAEEILASQTVDPIDGLVDDALLQVDAPAGQVVPFPGRLRRWVVPSVAGLAAAAAVLLMVRPSVGPEETFRLKGGDGGLAGVRLELLERHADSLRPLGDGATVRAGSVVVFRVHLADATCVRLEGERDGRPLDLGGGSYCLPAGTHVLEADGQALGLHLERPGPQSLRLVPIDRPDAYHRFHLLVQPASETPGG